MEKKSITYYDLNRDDSNFLYIDEIENAIDSLKTILYMLDRNDKLKWKWIILCLHHSIYHLCIANLKGTNYTQVLKNKESGDDDNLYFKRRNEKWKKSQKIDQRKSGAYRIKWIEIEGEPPFKDKEKNGINIVNEYLIPFWTAFARVQDGEFWMAKYIMVKPLSINENTLKSVEELVIYRNKFMHFVPIGSVINVDGFKKIVNPILDLISFLALTPPLKAIYNTDEKGIENIISEIKNKIK